MVVGLYRSDEISMYLGVPMFHERITKHAFSQLLNKVDDHLAKWKASVLSFAGQVSLAKSILIVLPNHLIQTIYLPRMVCDEFDKRICQFIWGDCHGNQ